MEDVSNIPDQLEKVVAMPEAFHVTTVTQPR